LHPLQHGRLYAVLKQFISGDPNGNARRNRSVYEGNFDDLTTYFFPSWGIPENQFHFSISDDKTVVFHPFQPDTRSDRYMAKL
jgi:hypothetical protein